MQRVATRVFDHLQGLGYYPITFRSSGGKGIHLFLVWDVPQDAYSVREFLRKVLAMLNFTPGTKGVVSGQVEIFPKQNIVPEGGCGNMFILPLAGESVPLWNDLNMEPWHREDATHIEWKSSPSVPVIEKPKSTSSSKHRNYIVDLTTLKGPLEYLDPSMGYDEWYRIKKHAN